MIKQTLSNNKGENENMKSDNIYNLKYPEIQKYFKNEGYSVQQLCIDEKSEIVTTFDLAKNTIGPVVDIRCPSRYKIFILGKDQLPEDADINTTYALKVRFTDSNNEEVAPFTRIRIKTVKLSEAITNVANMFYKDITITDYQKELPHKIKSVDKHDITAKAVYKFNQSILVNGAEHLNIEAINPDKTIDAKNVKLSLDIDLLEEE